MRFIAKLFACICPIVSLSLPSIAAEPWPASNRSIVFINPFAPGGASDAFSRPVAKNLTTQLGVPVIVDNKSGAGGTLGAAYAAKMPADGYGWFAGAVHHTIAQSLYPNLSYDITKDFEPIAILGSTPQVIVVNPNKFGSTDLKTIIAIIKKNPGAYNYGSAGSGTSQHLSGELFKQLTKTQITHVPYRGVGPALQDLVAGQIDIMFDTFAASGPFVKSGQLVAIAVASNKRVDSFPDVPTAAEAGLPNYVVSSWYGLWGVKGTPNEVLNKMAAEVDKALTSDELKEKWSSLAATAPRMSRAEFAKFVNQEVVRWREVIKTANIKLD
jgi:hypothetical protein